MIGWIQTDQVALRYELSGQGETTLVLVHEMAGSLNSWDDLVPLLPAKLRILRYDQRGSGMSEKITTPLSLTDTVADLSGLLDGLGINGRVTVMGMAAGCAIAVAFADTRPEQLESLILACPALGVPNERKETVRSTAQVIASKGLRAIAEGLLPNAFPDELWTDHDRRERAIARWLGADPEGYAATYNLLADVELSDALSRLQGPVHVLAGRYDPFNTPAMVERSTASVPRRSYQVIDGGHFASVQSPEVLADALAGILNS